MIENVKSFLPISSPQEFFKKPIIVVIALTALAAIVGYAIRSLWGRIQILPTLEKQYAAGMEAYTEQKYRQAIQTFKLVLGREPGLELKTKILAARAECYRSLGYKHIDKWDKALKDYDEVERNRPQDAQLLFTVHAGRADIYSRQEKYKEAILECYSASKIKDLSEPNQAGRLIIQGFSLYSIHVYSAALGCFNRAESLNILDCNIQAQIFFFRAKTYLATHALDKAFEDLNNARALKQGGLNFRSVFKELGQHYAQIGGELRAMECYGLALECRSSSTEEADILVHRGCFQRDKKEPAIKSALDDFRRAFDLDPNVVPDLEAIICWMYGLVCHEEKNDKIAIEQLTNAVKLNPSNKILSRILLALGQILFNTSQFKEALKKYTQGIYLCSDDETKARLLFARCEAYVSCKKPKTAIRDCKKALSCKIENEELRKQIQARQETLEKIT